MELAEMGFQTAILNAGLLLDRSSVFDSSLSYFAVDVTHSSAPSASEALDLNKYLAFNFFKMAIHHRDVKSEAMLKLGDYYFYGFQPLTETYPIKAA
jgi:hypothetical protein